jgi:hypothetical protein
MSLTSWPVLSPQVPLNEARRGGLLFPCLIFEGPWVPSSSRTLNANHGTWLYCCWCPRGAVHICPLSLFSSLHNFRMSIPVSDSALSARYVPEPCWYRLPWCLLLHFQFRTVLACCSVQALTSLTLCFLWQCLFNSKRILTWLAFAFKRRNGRSFSFHQS